MWICDGKLHRHDGPAVELADGNKMWYRNGNPIPLAETAAEQLGVKHREIQREAARMADGSSLPIAVSQPSRLKATSKNPSKFNFVNRNPLILLR